MFVAILITFIITLLVAVVIFLVCAYRAEREDNARLREANRKLSHDLNACKKDSAYGKGLYDGRSTDAIYRGMMKKLQSEGKAVIGLKGE